MPGRHFPLLLFISIYFGILQFLYSQPVSGPETGLPFIQNFTAKEYGLHPQNWVSAQDARGIMYFANTGGLLEFDGVNWRRHELFESLTIVSMAIDRQGNIFLGGRGEFGYLEVDSSGQFIYMSLLKYLPEEIKSIRMVWETISTTHGVYFRSKYHILRWNGISLKTWETKTSFSHLAAVRDTVYVLEKGSGLKILLNDSLQIIPGGALFADKAMNVILPYDTSRLLLGTRNDGLYIFDGQEMARFKTEADMFFRENQLYHGVRLLGKEAKWALATTRAGLLILNKAGKVLRHLNKDLGLAANKVHFVLQDRQGALWLSLNNGISRVEIASPFAIFDQRLGIEGTPHVMARYQGDLFIGTNRGLFRQDKGPSKIQNRPLAGQNFTAVQGVTGQVWALHATGSQLLVGTGGGIFSIQNKKAGLIASLPNATYCFYRGDENLIFAGTRNGLVVLKATNQNWVFAGKVQNISEAVSTIAGDKKGNLWLGTAFQGLRKVLINNQAPLSSRVIKYGKEHGLPGGMNYVYPVDGQVKIGTFKGLFHFSEAMQKFIPDSSLGTFLTDSTLTINRLAQDKKGDIWVMAGNKNSRLYHGRLTDGNYVWLNRPFRRLKDMNSVLEIYPEPNGFVWFLGRDEKIYRFDPNFTQKFKDTFSALVRRVRTIPGDSLIWGGSLQSPSIKLSPKATLSFTENSVRFEYAAPSYDQPEANRYQTKLEGYDSGFHPWTAETKKDYTGLPAGTYTFRVIAKNIYGDTSSEGRFIITVLAPWYQSWWAYILYLAIAVLIVVLIVKIRIVSLKQKTRQLESLVDDRTRIIREQAEKLEVLNTMKSRFFANISHEFRTPLTLILGPIDDMLARPEKKPEKKTLNLMQRNALRILQLINQLLDLSRLESGKLKLQVSRGDLSVFIKGIVMSFASLAGQKKIDLDYLEPSRKEDLAGLKNAYFDHDIIEKIFYNLLSNAFKFTAEGGAVQAKISNHKKSGFVEISIKDSGIGIPANRLETIFERFYQVDSGNTREQEGTGIGLALTKELVEQHHGAISVMSTVGEGTEFKVILPVSKEHFSADEIIDGMAPVVSVNENDNPRESSPEQIPKMNAVDALNPDSDTPIILVVDDHPDVRRYIRSHLEDRYKILEAEDGTDGVKKAIESIPDIIISDVMMPKLDGYQLCETLKLNEKTSHIPIVLLTAKAGEKDKISGLETGADDYLTKPFNSKELHVRVRNLIAQRRKLQERFQKEGMLKPQDVNVTSVEEAFLVRLKKTIEENLGIENFGVESLSAALSIGRRQLHRKIKAITGQTPTNFIRSMRLQRAKQLLEHKSGTVSEIAFQTGFGSLSYFSSSFKEQFGKLPSEI